jgi:dihydrofolate synthase/folylpolyglutamate synthase
LERTRALLAGVGDPHRHFHSVHVGGTNGKGSVSALIASALREAGRGPVGLYTSPHLVSFAERIRINGAPAADDLVLAAAERLRPEIDRTGATFFEATTAIAFLCFAEAGVETAVVEVGLGGRLDATNVIDPVAAAITNVSLEHTDYLGDTLEAIAREKAGILKAGVRAVTGERDPATLATLKSVALSAGASLLELDRITQVHEVRTDSGGTSLRLDSGAWGDRPLRVGLPGEHQARNAALAAETLALLPGDLQPDWGAVVRGFGSLRWAGRLQVERVRGTTCVLDVAHNDAGVQTLARALDDMDLPRPRVLVFAVLSDKDWRAMLPPLLRRVDAAIFSTPDSAPEARRWDPVRAGDWAREQGLSGTMVIPDLHGAVERAITLAPHGTVIVTGSFHTVGDAMTMLRIRVD